MSTPAQVAADLIAATAQVRNAVRKVVVTNGARLQTQAKANASGRPGPNQITGNFNRSINRRTTHSAASSTSEVGSSAPQAARLEHGFSGTDSLGRNYNQPAYPTFGPALDEIQPQFEADLANVADFRAGR